MAAKAQALGWDKPSRRRFLRFQAQAPLDVTVLRSGIPDTLPGRAVNLCERGIAAVLAGELVPGETVGIEIRLDGSAAPVRTRALVRYHDRLRCGMEFVGPSNQEQAAIRDWAAQVQAPPESAATAPKAEITDVEDGERDRERGTPASSHASGLRRPARRRGWIVRLVAMIVLLVLMVFGWRWNRSWQELESGLAGHAATPGAQPKAHVPAQEMERLLIHRVEPEYPESIRATGLQGVIVLDIVVGRDGSVLKMKPLNGPDVLARSATDALRWWKFEPYRLNGEPVVVETTVAVEFKP
jgi:TonB family protein